MHAIRKLVLLCTIAIAAIAIAASTASAQETPVELVNPAGNHCDPCLVHAVGNSSVVIIMGGMPIVLTECNDEVEMELWEDGTGHITQYTTTGGAACRHARCNGVGEPQSETEWPISASGETGPNRSHVTIRICIEPNWNPNQTGAHCNVEATLTENFAYNYTFSTATFCGAGLNADYLATWTTEDGEDVNFNVVHL